MRVFTLSMRLLSSSLSSSSLDFAIKNLAWTQTGRAPDQSVPPTQESCVTSMLEHEWPPFHAEWFWGVQREQGRYLVDDGAIRRDLVRDEKVASVPWSHLLGLPPAPSHPTTGKMHVRAKMLRSGRALLGPLKTLFVMTHRTSKRDFEGTRVHWSGPLQYIGSSHWWPRCSKSLSRTTSTFLFVGFQALTPRTCQGDSACLNACIPPGPDASGLLANAPRTSCAPAAMDLEGAGAGAFSSHFNLKEGGEEVEI
jgi:hypothetical protein